MSEYGQNGKPYTVGNTEIKVDDDFILATILAIVGVLTQHIPQFDEQTSTVAARIYEEIQKTNRHP
jgi:hypothetical protein